MLVVCGSVLTQKHVFVLYLAYLLINFFRKWTCINIPLEILYHKDFWFCRSLQKR